MAKAKVEIQNDGDRIVIQTSDGTCFEVVPNKDSLVVTAITTLGNSLIVTPRSNSSINLKQENI